MDFNKIQKAVYETYQAKGFEKVWKDCPDKMIADLAELGLIHTEVSEAQQSIRAKGFNAEVFDELADVVIRCMNFCSRKGFNLELALVDKANKNRERPYLHDRLA